MVGKNKKVATQLAPNCWPTCASQGKLVKVHNSIKGTQIETQTLAGGTQLGSQFYPPTKVSRKI